MQLQQDTLAKTKAAPMAKNSQKLPKAKGQKLPTPLTISLHSSQDSFAITTYTLDRGLEHPVTGHRTAGSSSPSFGDHGYDADYDDAEFDHEFDHADGELDRRHRLYDNRRIAEHGGQKRRRFARLPGGITAEDLPFERNYDW